MNMLLFLFDERIACHVANGDDNAISRNLHDPPALFHHNTVVLDFCCLGFQVDRDLVVFDQITQTVGVGGADTFDLNDIRIKMTSPQKKSATHRE